MTATLEESLDPPPPPCGQENGSRWNPERIREAIATTPAAVAFPELAARAGDILESWYQRFPLNVWSRFVRFADSGTGRKQQLPKVVKEFSESAPVLARLQAWVGDAARAGEPPVAIIDLCSGFGFLAMFASELLPAAAVEQIYLIDRGWPNRNVPGSKGGGISTAHIYDHGLWPIPLVTLQINVKNSRELRGLGHHVLQDPRPTIICGIHLCGTLSLRAIQLFNDGLRSGCGVIGLIMAPCCLPRRQHRDRRFCYEVGGHRFSAEELYDRKANVGLNAYVVYQKHLMACIEAPEKSQEEMSTLGGDGGAKSGANGDGHGEVVAEDKNVFFLARAPFRHAGDAAGADADFGRPVVVEGVRLEKGSQGYNVHLRNLGGRDLGESVDHVEPG